MGSNGFYEHLSKVTWCILQLLGLILVFMNHDRRSYMSSLKALSILRVMKYVHQKK